ncbi:MAG TPA: CRTAC1 family protein, partial [Planctomycetaceae bacterium]|nr:CRTAC1 family protein [Planctomycetaceae bacterium]
MLAREPLQSAAQWLAARAAVAAVELLPEGPERNALRQTAVSRFDKVLKLSPDIAAVHYELFDALRYSTSPDDLARAQRALREAHRLAPDNLFVLVDWLAVQAEQKDAEIAGTLAGLSQLVAPLREGIRTRSRVDVQTLIDDATKAAAAGTWPLATGKVRSLGAVLRPEEQAQSDRRRIAPHLLEFVLHDFQAATCPAADVSAAKPTAPSFVHNEVAWPLDGVGDLRGLAAVDFNLDGKLDVIVVGSESLAVLQQSEAATWTASVRLPLKSAYTGLVAVDFDRDANEAAGPKPPEICQDADPDVLAFGPGGVLLLKNELDDAGQRTLVNAIADQPLGEVRDALAAIPADFDHDGDLDVALSTPGGIQLWAQQGAWRFVDVSAKSQFPPGEVSITTIVAVDLDRDIDLDLVVYGPHREIGYLENLRHGELRYRPLEGAQRTSESVPLAVLEANGDVSWDMVTGGPGSVSFWLGDTPERGKFQLRKGYSPGGESGDHLLVGDINNDAAMDVLAWTANGVKCLLGHGDGTFSSPIAVGAVDRPLIDVSFADIDADGDLDLLSLTAKGLVLHRHELAGDAGWLSVRVRGAEDPQSGRVNQYGVGSLVEVRTGGRYQAQVITGQATHFGLGTQTQADSLRVVWTNGVPQVVLNPQPNQAVCERLALKGSCPYVYTWTGERFEFFTDLLWNAPVGLQFADGVLAPSRPWEYLLVPGNACQPRDGQYVMQITEELWETAYFDEVELIAVDHPADVEVFSNEKVGPADIAEMKAHTVRQHRTPVAAHD